MVAKQRQRGVSLLELMLALAVASLLIVLGLRMYQSFTVDQEAMQLQANVNTLFLAAGNYYRANCIQYKDSTGTVTKAGALDPSVTTSDVAVPVSTLVSSGFLNQWSPPPNSLVDTSDPTTEYIVQFNLISAPRNQCTVGTGINQCTQTVQVGTWNNRQIQVSVHMKNASMYQSMLGADCTSTVSSGGKVSACSADAPGNYLVWTRLSNFAAPEITTDFWPSSPSLEQFNQMYTTYPITTLTSGYIDVNTQYFLCGG